jgi:hypothetical protein
LKTVAVPAIYSRQVAGKSFCFLAACASLSTHLGQVGSFRINGSNGSSPVLVPGVTGGLTLESTVGELDPEKVDGDKNRLELDLTGENLVVSGIFYRVFDLNI